MPTLSDNPSITPAQKTSKGACRNCGSRRFHRSTLHSADFVQLLRLCYPVRCARCSQRLFVDFLTASMMPATKTQSVSRSRQRQNWRQWTSGSDAKTIEKIFPDSQPPGR